MAHSPINKILGAIEKSWSEHCSGHFFDVRVGLSGGVDSIVLLHALVRLQDKIPFRLSAIHVHHGLQAQADDWVLFCQETCLQWQIPLDVVHANLLSDMHLGVEGAARKARYQAYEQSQSHVLALAHHEDDQNETVLLALLRGGSVAALASMPQWRKLNQHQNIWRPLLGISKAALIEYASAFDLPYVLDPSNEDDHYLRNWLRNDILPQFQKKSPHYAKHLAKSISHCQDSLALQEEIMSQDLHDIQSDGYFDIVKWCEYSDVRRNMILHAYIRDLDIGMPSSASLNEFSRQIKQNPCNYSQLNTSDNLIYAYSGSILYNDKAFINNLISLYSQASISGIEPPKSLLDLGFNLLQKKSGLARGMLEKGWSIRAATSSDKIHLSFGRKSVFKVLQELKVPPHLRKIWPIMVNLQQDCMAICNGPVAIDFQEIDGLCLTNGVLQTSQFDGENKTIKP